MHRQKSFSLHQVNTKKIKKHCQTDQACNHCCSCWVKFKKQLEIRIKNVEINNGKLKEENSMFKKMNQKLSSSLLKFQKMKKQMEMFEQTKKKIEEELSEKMQKQKSAGDIILKEKVDFYTQQNKRLTISLEQTQKILKQTFSQLQVYKKQNEQMQQKINKQEIIITDFSNQKESLQQQLTLKKNNIISLEQLLITKTELIINLQKSLSDSENNYVKQKVKAGNLSFQTLTSQQQIKKKNGLLQTFKKMSEAKNRDIFELQKCLQSLNETCLSHEMVEGQLKHQILLAEDCVSMKQLQFRTLESDYFKLRQCI